MNLSWPDRHIPGARRMIILLAAAGLLLPACPQPVLAAEPAKPEVPVLSSAEKQQIITEILGPQESFIYQAEDRPDPFTPFVQAAVVKPVESTTTEEAEVLTGMRQFEPGQLHLVAIVFRETGPIAMVQDSAGKGYILKPGMLIGRHGEVDKIVPNAVLIKELSGTVGEETLYKTVEMVLRKEGEK